MNGAIKATQGAEGSVTHEAEEYWFNPSKLIAKANWDQSKIVGDIGAYWLKSLPLVKAKLHTDLKLVLLVRDKEEFIQSLERRWTWNKFTRTPRHGWIKLIPYIEGNSIKECANIYWEQYNKEAMEFGPFVLRTNDLNDNSKLASLYEYLGLSGYYPENRKWNASV